MAAFLHNEMRKHGVKLALGHTVEGFQETTDGVRILLKEAEPLLCRHGSISYWCYSGHKTS